jgi:hypothetical protein
MLNGISFLHFPNKDFIVELATNASDYAVGAALFQCINNKMRWLSFHSKMLSGTQQNYFIPKKELFVVYYYMEYYHYYLAGKLFYLHKR